MAVTLALIQYLPQIWMTWCLGHVGSLSIPMMLIQTPGSFVLSASLAARLGLGGWSNWGVFLVTGCLQGCLLVMGICFEVKARRETALDEGEGTDSRGIFGYFQDRREVVQTDNETSAVVEDESSERTPLINGSRKPI
ncbi:uncharacterized protein BP5553_04164 [Venustampulla echinocandica]|uniref:PQ loop repeat protein n=1 Tax=Venustampulla echinocandica TaxID=2656787 RepID=A0A370TWB9_9HELO|nr:uncharacterized protein BP5553_04164 [Venustampulla echinocandica]RDL39824.1 hypothetical protein BP5553_04164 [Venustampulla echinocandica]